MSCYVMFLYACMHVPIYVIIYILIYIYMYTYIYIHVYLYIYIYIYRWTMYIHNALHRGPLYSWIFLIKSFPHFVWLSALSVLWYVPSFSFNFIFYKLKSRCIMMYWDRIVLNPHFIWGLDIRAKLWWVLLHCNTLPLWWTYLINGHLRKPNSRYLWYRRPDLQA